MSNKTYWILSCIVFLACCFYITIDIQAHKWGWCIYWLSLMVFNIYQDYRRIKITKALSDGQV